MDDRKKQLLKSIIEEYVREAAPVGSKLLVSKYHLDYSPATARNEMMALEDEGYIMHPHTSAGRVPTEKGYEFYTAHFIQEGTLTKTQEETMKHALSATSDAPVKQVAKSVADVTDEAVFVGFGASDFYYTGLSNLFRKPEFGDVNLVINMSETIDHLDTVVADLFLRLQGLEVLIGHNNPFGGECSVVVAPYTFRTTRGILGILGPMRMDYSKNYRALTISCELLEHV
ncbi:MAG: hypothetical protein HYV34_00935 [Candidatus Kerfeldbacteria bacterium]|nr:hypothetical protein [Candidatus Kerfeldbacteria bacterium]